jgi:hypothetical protein
MYGGSFPEISNATPGSSSMKPTTSADADVAHQMAPSRNRYHSDSIQSRPPGVRVATRTGTVRSVRYSRVRSGDHGPVGSNTPGVRVEAL